MKTLGQDPTEEELQDMINEVDMDGNGTTTSLKSSVTLPVLTRECYVDEDAELKQAFNVTSTRTRNGKISKDELRDVSYSL